MVTNIGTRGASVQLIALRHHFELHGHVLPVLAQIDLGAAPGEFVALLGPSSCGKSTLLRLLAGLLRPCTGSVQIDERPVTAPDPSRILVFQDPTLYPWRTVRRNVALGLETRGLLRSMGSRVDHMLRQVGLDGFDNAYPHQLSGGMAQRGCAGARVGE